MTEPIKTDPTKEVGYSVQRNGMLIAGKESAHAIGTSVETALESAITAESTRTFAATMGPAIKGIGGFVTIGLAAGVSAGLTQMDYLHRKDNLKDMYREEIALKLKKPASKVSRGDLEELAKTNSTIQEELDRSSKQRTYGLGLSFISSMAALAVVILALPAIIPAGSAVAGMLAADMFTLPWVGALAIKGAVGLATYHAVKGPLHWVADKLFHIDEKTTNDYIVTIQRDRKEGRAISREQVLATFVASHPELAQHIINEYGKPFDSLSLEDKHQLVQELNQVIPLDRLTIEINSGKINPTELAFAVDNEASGVDHHLACAQEKKQGMVHQFFDGMVKVNLGKKSPQPDAHAADASPLMDVISHAQSRQAKTDMGGHTAHHVKQLEQSRAAEANLTHGIPG